MKENNFIKVFAVLVTMGIIVFAIIFGGMTLTKNWGKSKQAITSEKAEETLNRLYKNIDVSEITPRKVPVTLESTSLSESLPDISKYPAQVESTTELYIEIFSSTEKAGSGKDGWLVEVADEFNKEGFEINGRPVSVRLRGIASGTGTDYIISGKYIPDAFTPSNELWGEMIAAQGVKVDEVSSRLVGNVAGVLFSKEKNKELIDKYGAINLKNITTAVANNEIGMGYTNPFASSTGLNFLVSTLYTFDDQDILSDQSIQGFESFQTNIPFVAFTTLQMRESAKSGILDGFIMEYQTYTNDASLKSDYIFTPFGVRHDSPMYALGELSADKQALLAKFIEYTQTKKAQKLGSDYGFNNLDDYVPEMGQIDGDTIVQAQKLWKEKKNGSTKISAVFVADISGSMDGEPMNALKQSLLASSSFIGKEHSVGLVSFASKVNINLPIAQFDLNQRSLFAGAITDLQASGGTAMFDAIIVATKMLLEERVNNPDAKLMLFVLTDGETNRGYSFDDIKDLVEALRIPIYTIGYNADIQVLQNLSNINEAASVNADTDDVIYKLQNLFNAEM